MNNLIYLFIEHMEQTTDAPHVKQSIAFINNRYDSDTPMTF